jgi:hypothetical protein
VPPKEEIAPPKPLEKPSVVLFKTPEVTHEFDDTVHIGITPVKTNAATPTAFKINPAVLDVSLVLLPAPLTYPVTTTPPEVPSCIKKGLVALPLTPLNITVMRLTHDGMLVKSILVPDVDATDVPLTNADARPAPPHSGYQVVFAKR